MNIDDEKDSEGYWDKAAEIATEIGLNFKSRYPDKFDKGEPIYAEDFGQEIIYNAIKYGVDINTEQTKENTELNTLKFIYPLFGHIYDSWENCDYDISSEQLTEHQELLEERMKEYQLNNGEGMEQFFDANKDVQSKLKSIVWNFEKHDGKLYGVTTANLTGEIDDKGISDLKNWISGQNSDGLGEGFEQQDFDIDEGRLSVSLWDFNGYFIYTEEEFQQYRNTNQNKTVVTERRKPDCELIGQDGNIFNLMGIASRTLRRNGMADEATEMCNRIRESGSYEAALCIIGEYVNITGPDEDMSDNEGFTQSM